MTREEVEAKHGPFYQLLPHNEAPGWGSAAALKSAAEEVISRTQRAPCDSPAVSDCLRCNSYFLAKAMLDLLTRSESPAGKAALGIR